MLKEVLDLLRCRPGGTYVDATIGLGGHAEALLEKIQPDGQLIGIDRDKDSLEKVQARLKRFAQSFRLVHDNYKNLPLILNNLAGPPVDGILVDLGVSSYQLLAPERGFSFQSKGALDMRMDRSSGATAADIVNGTDEVDLANMIYQFGEERYSRRIARAIVRVRAERPFTTTSELASVIESAVPGHYRHGRIHCATRTFQALRIAVNQELDHLEPALRNASDLLAPGGRLCVISFHSLEDRIVKQTFRALSVETNDELEILTKRPQLPTEEEVRRNPRSRSAKLRVIQRIAKEAHT